MTLPLPKLIPLGQNRSNYKQVLASWKKTIQELLGILMDMTKKDA